MIVISHRGNLHGRYPSLENDPNYILQAIECGFEVEIDVWHDGSNYFLGHDFPQHKVEESFLKNERLWCHAKNMEALVKMTSCNIHCFWHQTDDCTLTSRGFIWCFPGIKCSKGILVHPDAPNNLVQSVETFGVCTDYPVNWNKISVPQSSLT